jgi:hypothetical protein
LDYLSSPFEAERVRKDSRRVEAKRKNMGRGESEREFISGAGGGGEKITLLL